MSSLERAMLYAIVAVVFELLFVISEISLLKPYISIGLRNAIANFEKARTLYLHEREEKGLI